MSFSARTGTEPKGSSGFTASPTRPQSTPMQLPPAGRQRYSEQGAPMRLPSLPTGNLPQARRASVAAVPTPVDDSMVPLEAPKQGVWFDRAPFDAATGRDIDEGDRSAQGASRGTAERQAHGIGESADADTGPQHLSYRCSMSPWAVGLLARPLRSKPVEYWCHGSCTSFEWQYSTCA